MPLEGFLSFVKTLVAFGSTESLYKMLLGWFVSVDRRSLNFSKKCILRDGLELNLSREKMFKVHVAPQFVFVYYSLNRIYLFFEAFW